MATRSRRVTKTPGKLEKVEMDARLKDLVDQIAARGPAEDLTEADIDREVQAIRNAARQA